MKRPTKKNKPTLTELGKAIRYRDAEMVSAWERDYSEAIKVACSGDVTRLLNLLRAHRRPNDDDLDQLADFIEARSKRKRGRERDEAVHEVARLADIIMHMGEPLHYGEEQRAPIRRLPTRPRHYVPLQERHYKLEYEDQYWAYSDVKKVPVKTRTAAINIARREYERTHGVLVNPARVRDLLNRPKKRHRPK